MVRPRIVPLLSKPWLLTTRLFWELWFSGWQGVLERWQSLAELGVVLSRLLPEGYVALVEMGRLPIPPVVKTSRSILWLG